MKTVCLIVFFLIVGLTAGYYYGKTIRSSADPTLGTIKAMRTGQQGLINPLVEYEIDSQFFSKELVSFHDNVQKMVNLKKQNNEIEEMAIYFRSLNDGPWFGIKEDQKFFPASLLKLPILMAYLKKSETDPEILKKQVAYDDGYAKTLGDSNSGTYYPAEKKLEIGKTYTIEELLEYMIAYSSNNAKNVLIFNIDTNEILKVYMDLGVANDFLYQGNNDILSVHGYSNFLRVLYNASYLNKENSKKALELLSKTTFNKGIVASLPKEITVSHKFGEHIADQTNQLHDCGIVYYPNNPYILCIMARGESFPKLEKALQDISNLVYNEVNRQITPGQ